MKNTLKKLQYIGIQYSDSFQLTKRIILLNYLSFLYAILPLPYMIFLLWLGIPVFAWLIPIICVFFSVSLYFNYKGKSLVGSVWIILSVLLATTLYTGLFGLETGIQYMLYPLFLTPSILISDQNNKLRFSLMITIVMAFFGLEIIQFQSPFSALLTNDDQRISRIIVLFDTFTLFCVLIYFKLQMINQLKLNLHHYLKIYKLTERENEIVVEVCNGLNNKDIAKKLYVEEGTVKTHLNNIFKKLNVKTRSELVSLTFKSG
jgi:DNA-binding CsgD family transcriptional regulator